MKSLVKTLLQTLAVCEITHFWHLKCSAWFQLDNMFFKVSQTMWDAACCLGKFVLVYFEKMLSGRVSLYSCRFVVWNNQQARIKWVTTNSAAAAASSTRAEPSVQKNNNTKEKDEGECCRFLQWRVERMRWSWRSSSFRRSSACFLSNLAERLSGACWEAAALSFQGQDSADTFTEIFFIVPHRMGLDFTETSSTHICLCILMEHETTCCGAAAPQPHH